MVTCPLCGQAFDETAPACRGRCPLAGPAGCSLVCCPHCGYQTVNERRSTAAALLRRLWPAAPQPKRKPSNDDAFG